MTKNFMEYRSDVVSLKKAIYKLNETIIRHDDIVVKQLSETAV